MEQRFISLTVSDSSKCVRYSDLIVFVYMEQRSISLTGSDSSKCVHVYFFYIVNWLKISFVFLRH